ncbi:MAG: hypothetical protein K5831_15205 [Brevundimonas sp.]|uniref:limonene-1,2-epoxide hydrolase family protein n=1 Tax=Brevundimonas sp. TaxID=1871086 RepID=UPI002587E814|nr:limonene-1,2-epoxide hydrolase family protein [Brevundimonas sp.]MCV0416212.1 hypothetical protein [Brevundimonas sp.]
MNVNGVANDRGCTAVAGKLSLVDVRAISIFEVDQGVITHWRDHADLAEVPKAETDLWRRLGGARW